MHYLQCDLQHSKYDNKKWMNLSLKMMKIWTQWKFLNLKFKWTKCFQTLKSKVQYQKEIKVYTNDGFIRKLFRIKILKSTLLLTILVNQSTSSILQQDQEDIQTKLMSFQKRQHQLKVDFQRQGTLQQLRTKCSLLIFALITKS